MKDNCAFSGNTKGRNDKEKGQIGVKSIPGTEGCTKEPPAAILYAVDPHGVAIITLYQHINYPSANILVKNFPFMKHSIFAKAWPEPRSRTMSFIAFRPSIRTVGGELGAKFFFIFVGLESFGLLIS